MRINQTNGRYDLFRAMGTSGMDTDVDTLMQALVSQQDFSTSRLVDFALGLVETPEGVGRLHHFLLNGEPIQRNYAALYFKRRGDARTLHEAVNRGAIDWEQAFSQ